MLDMGKLGFQKKSSIYKAIVPKPEPPKPRDRVRAVWEIEILTSVENLMVSWFGERQDGFFEVTLDISVDHSIPKQFLKDNTISENDLYGVSCYLMYEKEIDFIIYDLTMALHNEVIHRHKSKYTIQRLLGKYNLNTYDWMLDIIYCNIMLDIDMNALAKRAGVKVLRGEVDEL